jgi:thiol-disulfide isomerase/thioredoxin
LFVSIGLIVRSVDRCYRFNQFPKDGPLGRGNGRPMRVWVDWSHGGKVQMNVRVGRIARLLPLAFVAASLALASAGLGAENWLTNYDEAMAESTKTGKPVLALFTGSDWCPHCRTLEERVLATPAFGQWAEEHVVLLMVDLPESGITPEVRSERSRICIKYGVRTFPTVLVLDSFGEKVAEEKGYRGLSAASWIKRVAAKTPAPQAVAEAGQPVLSSLGEAVDTARKSKRPILLVVSGSREQTAAIRSATLVNDPEFHALSEESFVVAALPATTEDGEQADASLDLLLGGRLEPDAVEVIVTDDGETPVFMASGSQSPQRIVSGLRRFLVARQTARRAGATRR